MTLFRRGPLLGVGRRAGSHCGAVVVADEQL